MADKTEATALNAKVVPAATDAQQRVIDRISAQRERLRARRSARAQSQALAQRRTAVNDMDESLAVRTIAFAKDHPLALAAIAGMGLLAGPRRLVRWAGVVLPLVMKFKR
jgi:hypothetical protein